MCCNSWSQRVVSEHLMLSGGLCAPSTQDTPSCFSRRPSLPQIHKAILDLWLAPNGETRFPKWIDRNHDCHLLLRTTSRPITYKLSQSTSPRQVSWITMENNITPKFIPCFEYIPELLAHIQVSTWHVDMGAMIGISGLTCKPLGFAPKLYSKLSHITISPKTTC